VIDHVGLLVADYARSKAFFLQALAPLGYTLIREFGPAGGFGADGTPDFWIAQGAPAASVHLAFRSRNRATVDAFHRAALAAGGRDNGAPGLRARYHAQYYGAFVYDPDGNNVEAVCHLPE
jgi:catechol 2,3-dioxygenase-like lactoylglutathione lyase family enzyme